MTHETFIAAYDTSAQAADGLALAHVLAGFTGSEVVVARVLVDGLDKTAADRMAQRIVRESVAQTRQALVAALPEAREDEIVPVVNAGLAAGLHDLVAREEPRMLVFGSSHHGAVGRLILGGGAEAVANGSPCPVAVAPPGFREKPVLHPSVIGVAYDGSEQARRALPAATEIAQEAGVPLRLVAVDPPWWGKRLSIHHHPHPLEEAAAVVAELSGDAVATEAVELAGNPADQLVHACGRDLGLLVMGSRSHGPVRRVLLGSVSASVLGRASCPVVIVPAGSKTPQERDAED